MPIIVFLGEISNEYRRDVCSFVWREQKKNNIFSTKGLYNVTLSHVISGFCLCLTKLVYIMLVHSIFIYIHGDDDDGGYHIVKV